MRRLILFDIDGTLLKGGPAKEAFTSAMEETYGAVGPLKRVSFGGKTDPQIARELLTLAGLDDDAIDSGFLKLWSRYLAHLEVGLNGRPMIVLPGVVALLDALRAFDDGALGLVTGNIFGGAQLKLSSANLWDRFQVGGFGSDHEERDELPAIALRRARVHWATDLSANETFVVGDTPRDVACGRAGGTRTVAVATGTYTARELEATGADHVLEDLSVTPEVVELLTS